MKIKVSDFSETPAGRYRSDGPQSGEVFREDILVPAYKEALRKGEELTVVIDEVEGYGSSFLEEAFGGLVRSKVAEKDTLLKTLKITFSDTYFDLYKDRILSYIKDA